MIVPAIIATITSGCLFIYVSNRDKTLGAAVISIIVMLLVVMMSMLAMIDNHLKPILENCVNEIIKGEENDI